MSEAYPESFERRAKLLKILRSPGTSWEYCHTVDSLQKSFEDDYPDDAGRRKLQRDLQKLRENGQVQANQTAESRWFYRRAVDDLNEDRRVRRYAIDTVGDLLKDAIQSGTLTETWQRILVDDDLGLLDRDRLVIIPDHFQLQQAQLSASILLDVVRALVERQQISVSYRKRNGMAGHGKLHPHGIIHRGPIPYLLAVKEGEPDVIKHFPVHRMSSVSVLPDKSAEVRDDFDLQAYVKGGHGDFGQGEWLDLELLVKGYVAEILEVCPLSADQRFEVEPEGARFEVRVTASVPSTGTLFRWLLAGGANIEVVAPEGLRRKVAAQLSSAREPYENIAGHARQ